MSRLVLLSFILVSPIYLYAQYEGVYKIPLPEEFSDYKESTIIYSTPNPDFPVHSGEEDFPVVWKHQTIIKAEDKIKVIETGAYLLYKGEWVLRAAFPRKMTKKMFNARSLKLSKGDSIVFKENWRYGNYTQTGWNFWYVKAINAKGEKIFSYEILETKGTFKDGLQILPLMNDKSCIDIPFTDEKESLSIIKMEKSNGNIQIKNDSLISFAANMIFRIPTPLAKNGDIELILKNTKKLSNKNNQYNIKGEICLNGECNEEEWTVKLASFEKTHQLSFDLNLDKKKYSSSLYNSNNKLPLHIQLSFKKDYPGSMPWNDLGKYGK